MVDSRLNRSATVVDRLLNLPRGLPLVVDQSGIIVALVEELQNGGEYLWLFVGEGNPLVILQVHHLPSKYAVEERRCTEDVLVSGEYPLLLADNQGHDRRRQIAKEMTCKKKGRMMFLMMAYLGDSAVCEVVAVVGRRRGSWRRLETPASLLNEEVDLPYLWLFEKLLFWGRS